MNSRKLFILVLVCSLIFSIGSVFASDVNTNGTLESTSVEDNYMDVLPIEDTIGTSVGEELLSEDSKGVCPIIDFLI